jgi:hypothetical protein
MIDIYLMYRLGGRAWSAGIADNLGPKLRVLPGVFCPPTYNWSDWQKIVDFINRRGGENKIAIAGHSLGANVIPEIAAAIYPRKVSLVVGYDPSIWYPCPALPSNVERAICFHGVNWLNPIGHALYRNESTNTTIETVNTWTLHASIDDDNGLHGIAVRAVKELL